MMPAWLLVLAIRAADYTGSAACAPCHPALAKRAAGSRHALALLRTAETDLGARLSAKPIRDGTGTEFRYQVEADGVRAVVSPDGGAEAPGVLDGTSGRGLKPGRWFRCATAGSGNIASPGMPRLRGASR